VPDFVIKTQFKAADKLSPVLKKIGIRVDRVGDKATRSFRRATKSASVFGGVLKGILAAGLIQRGVATAGLAVRTLGEEFLDFDRNITKAITRLPGGLDRGSQAFKDFGRIAREEAARTEFTAGQTAEAVEQLALAGMNVQQVMSALPGVLNLATNAGVEVADATRMAVKSMGAFGLRSKDTAVLQENLTRVNNVFSRAVSSATLDMVDMFETLKFAGPSMFAAGQSIETFAAATELLADRSIDASIAGTSLRMAFVRLAKPPAEARKALKKLGIEVAKDGVFRDFADILADIEKKTAKMGNRQKLATISTIFGVRAQGALNALVEAGSDTFRKYRGSLEDSTGASKKMSDVIRQSVGVRLLRLKSALIEVGFNFIDAFSGKAGQGIEDAIEAVRKFDVKSVVKGLKDVIQQGKELIRTIKPFAEFLPPIIAMWVAYRAALIAVTVVQAAAFFVKLAGAIKAASAAQGILNAIMIANPIGLVTIAIVGLVGALVILITKYDDVISGWEEVFINMEITAKKFWMAIKNAAAVFVNGILEVISAIPKAIGNILGIDIGAIELPRVKFVDDEDMASLREAEMRLKNLRKESAGLGVARGAAGIRGAIGGAPGGRAAAPRPLSAAGFAVGQGRQLARQAVETLFEGKLEPPNRSEVEARNIFFEGRMSFENAPAGAQVEAKTTGARPVAVEGLGTQ
jgi:TP901 family phage tail tape measure protein